MSTQTPARKPVGRRTLLLALTGVVVLLIVTVLVGAEAYARQQISRCISGQFEQEMGSSIDVGFGAKPMLLTYFDGRIDSVTVDSEDNRFGPAVGMVVHAEFEDIEVADQGRGGGSIGSSHADVTWDNDGITRTLGGMVSGVESSAGTGLLTLDVLGGLAQLEVLPVIENGNVTVETESAHLLGIGLPTDLVQSIVETFTESLQSYPLGLQPTSIQVTDDGIEVELTGGRTELAADPNAGTDFRC